MNLSDLKYIYFLGIGGIGMSALARWFKANGYQVSGYDRTRTPLTDALEQEGIPVHFTDSIDELPQKLLHNKEQSLVVLTPAVPAGHQELNYLRENGFRIKKRSEVLGIITQLAKTIGVAGTHGKTTTSSFIAHLLHHAKFPASAFLGGISVNLNSNILINSEQEKEEVVVVEADEFDRSFLTLHPHIAIVTSADADHLDIYGNADALHESFRDYISQIKPNGYLIIHHELKEKLCTKINPLVTIFTYGLEDGDLHASDIHIADHKFQFDIISPLGKIENTDLAVPGFHNVENALAAVLAAQIIGLSAEELKAGVAAYRGVKRRFEYVLKKNDQIFIDDYAHHPREIEAFIKSVKALYPGKKLRVIFQPHLYSRTRDFAPEFAASLSLADEVWLLDIYPARELPIEGVSSGLILNQLENVDKKLLTKEELLEQLGQDSDFEVLATVGAGDIDALVIPIKNILEKS